MMIFIIDFLSLKGSSFSYIEVVKSIHKFTEIVSTFVIVKEKAYCLVIVLKHIFSKSNCIFQRHKRRRKKKISSTSPFTLPKFLICRNPCMGDF